ncbi:MAG TPA: lysylphosphatidylglycerol synthase transmembrane domain-containing protein [Bacteroidota bacterium]|nr:lysylphosphatidylglycerol synthase transmembrane domain-containing protein [Bacteroidota bacterium]
MLQESPLHGRPLSRGRRVLQYALSAALTVLFLWIAFRGTDPGKLFPLVRGANYWWMLLMFACTIASHAVRSWRWGYLLSPIKRGIGFRNLFAGVMIGYMFNNILPRAGEIARPYAISRSESLPASSAFGTIVVERIIDTFSFLLLVALLPLAYDGPLVESFPWLERAGWIITGVTAAGLIFLVAMMLRRDWTDRFLLRPLGWILPRPLMVRLEAQVHAFLDGFLFLKNPATFAVIVSSGLLVWALYFLMTYVALFAFGLGPLGPRAALVLLTISSIGVAIPTPGSTGSYHAFTSQTLIQLYAVDPSVALGFATVTHAVGFVGVTLLGGYYFFRDRLAYPGGAQSPEPAKEVR